MACSLARALALSLPVMVTAPACSSIASQVAYFGGEDLEGTPMGMVYLGTCVDLVFAISGSFCCGGGPQAEIRALGIADLPFSLAADTALLPVAFVETVELSLRRTRGGKSRRREPDLDELP